MTLKEIVSEVYWEVDLACSLHAPQLSPHELYAVLLEGVDEFWDLVKQKNLNREQMRKKLVQVAAMAVRAIHDLEL